MDFCVVFCGVVEGGGGVDVIISIQYVIILCNDVTRACSGEIGQNFHLRVCDTIEGLMSICYDWRFDDFFTFTDVASVPISNI